VFLALAFGVCVVARNTTRGVSGQYPNPVGMTANGDA
jgi:hypothetical protein